MTKQESSLDRARAKYEKERRGKVVMRVQLSANDDAEEWEKIRKNMVKKYGSAKDAIYELAKKDGLI